MDDQEDSEFLDSALDTALQDLESGVEPDIARLTAERPHLRSEVRRLLRTLRDVAVVGGDPPPRLPGFTISGEVGRGGMGRVFLAGQDHLGGRPVALKVWRRMGGGVGDGGVGGADAAVEQLRAEASALARVRHPGVVTVHDVMSHEGSVAIAMEWVEGTTLAGVIDAVHAAGRDPGSGALSLEAARAALGENGRVLNEPSYTAWVCKLGVQVARALGAAHSAGVLHRDVKPSNILIRRDGAALLSDFGLATLEFGAGVATGRFAGTLAYAAPEQVAGREMDVRADVYALGATLFHAVSLTRPHEIDGAGARAGTPSRGAAPHLRSLDSRIPQDLESIIERAMAESPQDRYGSADEMADDLERLLRLEPVRARPTSAAYVFRKFVARNRLTVGAAAAVIVALAIGLTAALIGRQRAIDSRNTADASAARSRMSEYVASIQAAAAHLRSDDTDLAARQLETAPPELRGWEWRYLHGQLDRTLGSVFAFKPRSARHKSVVPQALAIDSTGLRLAATSSDGSLAVIDLPMEGHGPCEGSRELDLKAGLGFNPMYVLWHEPSGMLIVGEYHGPRVAVVDPESLSVNRTFALAPGASHVRIAASPCGDLFAVHAASRNGDIIEIRSAADDTVLARPLVHGRANRAEFVGGSEWLVLQGDRAAWLLNWRTGERTSLDVRVDGVGQGRDDLAVSADGSRFAFGSQWLTQAWSFAPLQPIATLASESPFNRHCLGFSPDGSHLFSYEGPRLRGWEIATTRQTLAARTGRGTEYGKPMCVSPDGRFVYTGHDDGSIRAWSTETPAQPTIVSCPEGGAIDPGFARVACRADGAGDNDKRRVLIRSAATGGVVDDFVAGEWEDQRIDRWFEFSRDGKWLVRWMSDRWHGDGLLCARELSTGKTYERVFTPSPRQAGLGPCLLTDRVVMAVTGGLEVCSFPTLETQQTIPMPGSVVFLSHSNDRSRFVAVAAIENGWSAVQIRDGASSRLVREIRRAPAVKGAHPLAFLNPDGSLLVTAYGTGDGTGHTLELTDVTTGETLDTWTGPFMGYPGLVFDPSGTRLAVGFKDGTIRLFAVVPMPPRGKPTLTEVLSLRADSWMLRPSFSDDGTRLACVTVYPSNRCVIWDARPESERLADRRRAKPAPPLPAGR